MMLSDSQFDAAAQAVVQPDTDPIDHAAQQVAGDRKTQMRASLYSSLMANPDMAARAQRLGRKTGLPGDVVERNLPEVERSAALTDIDRALDGSPLLAQWMADPKNARVSHDDVPQMGAIEAAVKWLVSAPGSPSTLGGSLRSAYHGASAGSAGVFQAVSGTVAPLLDFLEPVQGIGGNPLRRLQEGFGLIAQDALASQKAARGKSATWLGSAVDSGVESLAQNAGFLPLALLPGGQAAALTGMSAMAGGQTYTQDIQKGQGHWTAAMHGASDALIEGWTERFALGRLIGEVRAGAPLFQTLLKNAALEVPGEQAATALQDLNDWAVNNNGRTFGDYLKERPEAAAQTLIATLVGVGGNVAIMKGVQGVADRAAGTERRAQLAEQHGQALADVSKLIEASKLRQRDPEAFATFAQSLTEEGVSILYVDARALQQSGVDLQALAQAMPSVAQQIEQAAATGGDVVIPTAEFLAQAPGQEWSAALIDHARTGADAMSPAGAREYMQAHGEQLQEEIARTIEQHATNTEWQAGRDAVRADFQRQLDEVGRWQPDVNRQYAALLGDYYAATAARAGMTPQELAERYPLRVTAQGATGEVHFDQVARAEPTGKTSPITRKPIFELFDASGQRIGLTHSYATAEEAVSRSNAPKPGAPSAPTYTFPEPDLPPRSNWKQVKGQQFSQLDEDDGYLYHITAAPQAGGIRENGLVPNRGSMFGGAYEAYSDGKVFLTERGGVSFWKARVEEQLQHSRDNPPAVVVMRIPKDKVKAELTPDDIGTKDARARAYYSTETLRQSAKLHGTFDPNDPSILNQSARGQIAFGQDITQAPSVISLFDGADWSTLIHEAGHFFLEAHMDLAARIAGRIADGEQVSDGERGIVADANALLGWFGVTGAEQAGGAVGGALEQPAYHGTPHRGIDKFSTDKIGTGEGAQVYGWGLYFAGKREIAEWYREKLAESLRGWNYAEVAKGLGVENYEDFRTEFHRQAGSDQVPVALATKRLQNASVSARSVDQAKLAAMIQAFRQDKQGQLYEVDIPEDSEMLLWDKPLSEQPGKARRALKAIHAALSEGGVLDDYLERKNADWEELTGQDVYEIAKRASLDDALPSNGPGVEEAQAAGQDDKAASMWLWNEGLSGIKYLDGTSRNAGDGSYNYVIFSGDDVAIKNTFYQGGQTDARPEPPPIGRTPLETWSMMSIDQKRAYHEQFARGFELYALDGKAPSLSLQSVFQRFGVWLKNVYRSITQRSAEDVLQVTLTDEVRQVMDRMIATDEQIAEAQAMREMGPLFGGADQAGMTPEQWAQYHELAAQATAQASEQLQARGLRDMQWLRNARSRELKRLQDRAAGLRREVEIEVRREVLSTPLYRAWQFLTTKGDAQVTAQPTPRVKASGALDNARDNLFTAIAKLGGLDRAEAVSAWGVDPKDRLESGVFGAPVLRKEGGLSIDAMAERLVEEGYLLPDENGRADVADLETAFDSQRRGVDQFSTWHDYAERARVAQGEDAPEALPDEILHGKLDTAVLRDMYGTQPEAIWRTLSTRRMTSEASGIHPEVVAETFGYDSADALVRALAAADPPRQVIEGMTDQRMLERYGDLATPEGLQREADKAIHNEARARAIATELDALEKMGRVREPAGGRATADVLAKAARDYALAVIGAKKVRDIRPGEYTAAEARASKAAQKAFKAGDTQAAATEKRHQLIQHAAAKAALQAREEVEKAVEYLRRMAKRPKGLDAGYADQIDQLLERFDLKAVSNKELDKRSGLAAWVESQREQGMEPDIAPELLNEAARTNWRNLTLDELRGLRDAVKQIEHLGRLKGKLLASKAKRDFEAVRDELADSIDTHARGRTADTRTPATVLGRRLAAIKRFGAAHIKAATWARIFDGGRDGGPVWEFLIRGANVAGDFETTRRAQATEALTKILAPVMKSSKLHRKAQYASVNRSLTREQVLVMALNTGNDGNWQRMLDGEGWTRPQVMAVLNTLTATEWQAVQGVWDHMESYRPEIGAKEKRVYGKEPEWVQAVPLLVDTADGQRLTLRGGYFPIKYDPAANAQAEQHADAEDAKQMMRGAYTSATTRRGFTKSRVQEVKGRPLMYSLGAVYGGVQDVIHDLAWHEWLIDTNKLLRSTKVDGAIRQHYGPEVVRQFKEWVKDVAAGDRPQQAAVDEALSRVRRGVSMAGLGFNVMSAAMQPLGLTQSIVRVGAPWVARGVAQYIANPLAATRRVVAASDFMAGRSRTRFRELNELRNQVEGESGAMQWVNRNAFWLMLRAQQAVDVPTWLGAYEKAISDGSDDARAVALADQAVLDAQGGGQVKDQAGIERGGPAQKLFTVFYSFMNTALNAGVVQTMTADTRAKKAKLAVDLLLLYTVPAVLGALLKDALTPGDSGDDEPEELAKKLAAAQLDYLMGLFMLVRETTESVKIVTGLTDRPRDYAGPAGLRLIPDAVAFAKQAGQGELDDAFRKAAVNLTGDLFGLPAAQVNRTITGAKALAEDETDNPAALVFGFQKDR